MRSHRHLIAAEGGFTLAEVLVSIVVFGLVAAVVTEASISGLSRQMQLQNREDALAQARTALERVDRDIRSADVPVYEVSPTRIMVGETQASGMRTMTYWVDGASLKVDETDYSTSGSTSNAPTRILLNNLVDLATDPVFSFSSYSGYQAPSGTNVNAATCEMPGGAIDTGCVGTIKVDLSVQPEYLGQPVSVSDNGTELRNRNPA